MANANLIGAYLTLLHEICPGKIWVRVLLLIPIPTIYLPLLPSIHKKLELNSFVAWWCWKIENNRVILRQTLFTHDCFQSMLWKARSGARILLEFPEAVPNWVRSDFHFAILFACFLSIVYFEDKWNIFVRSMSVCYKYMYIEKWISR